ncbi:MAG: 6-phosphogluconate dehydrogenase [Flavobacteriaceae bacterium]|nr:6-phosphogluconate dehydrogenase [Flavobacteriaceae bacterium]
MKKFLTYSIIAVIVAFTAYFVFIYFVNYSEGYRAGQLVKISKRGVMFKTWEGTLSQGVSEEQQFRFSVESGDKEVVNQLKELQGQRVKLTYIERFGTFAWLGDTKYYVKEVKAVQADELIEQSAEE